MVIHEYNADVIRDENKDKAVILYNLSLNQNYIWVIEIGRWRELNKKVEEGVKQCETHELEEEKEKQMLRG